MDMALPRRWVWAASFSLLIHLCLSLSFARFSSSLPSISIPINIEVRKVPPAMLKTEETVQKPIRVARPSFLVGKPRGVRKQLKMVPAPILAPPAQGVVPLASENPSPDGTVPVESQAATGTEVSESGLSPGNGERRDGTQEGVPVFTPLIAVTKMPVFKTRVSPLYPDEAKQLEKVGTVILNVSISKAGEVLDVILVKKAGFGFDEAAIEAIRQSHFDPARVGDQPVAVTIRMPIRFRFKD
jgi:TonB family protein